jgi:nucleoside-diphosphate-sugar epimerase
MNIALVVGAGGVVGNTLARRLIASGYTTYGLARRPPTDISGLRPITADLQDPDGLLSALKDTKPSHVFIAAWLRQETEAENIRVNAGMVRNVLTALSPEKSVRHVALVTGLKHYLGPFESYASGNLGETPFREDQARLEIQNFYYAQEDELWAAAARENFHWNVHRPHTIIGYAIGNAMNMGVTLATYATICRETGRPFIFPGSAMQWNGLTDMTDADLLARQLIWAAETEAAYDQAFNTVNGDVFRWRFMWSKIAAWFGIEAAPFPAETSPLEKQLAGTGDVWKDIAKKYDLVESDVQRLSSPWHTDADLGRPIEVMADMSRSRALGFREYEATDQSFFRLFERLRAERIIPSY